MAEKNSPPRFYKKMTDESIPYTAQQLILRSEDENIPNEVEDQQESQKSTDRIHHNQQMSTMINVEGK